MIKQNSETERQIRYGILTGLEQKRQASGSDKNMPPIVRSGYDGKPVDVGISNQTYRQRMAAMNADWAALNKKVSAADKLAIWTSVGAGITAKQIATQTANNIGDKTIMGAQNANYTNMISRLEMEKEVKYREAVIKKAKSVKK